MSGIGEFLSRLGSWLAAPGSLVVVEPETAPAVAAALAEGRPVRVGGDLETTAEMLSCGVASAPALEVLRRGGARSLTVSEDALEGARMVLRDCGGPRTTTSGSASLAGALAEAGHRLDSASRVLILVTEADLAGPV